MSWGLLVSLYQTYPHVMTDEAPYVRPFRESLHGVVDALNAYRQEHGRPPVERNRMLNFNAYDRARHLMAAGLADETPLINTVRAFKGQDVSEAVELVRQWPGVKSDPAGYLFPWQRDETANAVLLGDYGYMGCMGDIVHLDKAEDVRIVFVMLMTKERPTR